MEDENERVKGKTKGSGQRMRGREDEKDTGKEEEKGNFKLKIYITK